MSTSIKTVSTIFHADLSDAHSGEDYFIAHAGKRIKLVAHDKESLAASIGDEPHLLSKKQAQSVTHYSKEKVNMPLENHGRIHIRHTMKTFPGSHGKEGISHSAIYFPPDKVAENTVYHSTPIDYISTAKCFLFHHPDLVTKDGKGAKTIYGIMDEQNIATKINQLAIQMRSMGPPAENSGWATLQPFVEKSEEADYDKKSWGTYRQHPSDPIQKSAFTPLQPILETVNNTASLKDVKWTVQNGQAVDSSNGSEQLEKYADLLAVAPEQRKLLNASGDDWNVAIANTAEVNQLKFSVKVINAGKNQVEVTFNNSAFRYLGLYVTFYDAQGKAMSLPNWTPDDDGLANKLIVDAFDNQYDTMRFIGLVSPMNSVYAIPLPPTGETSSTFTFPPGAVSASLFGSGLGTGADLWPKTPALGGVLTGVFNLGVPSLLLVVGAAAQTYKPLYDIVSDLAKNKKFLVAAAVIITAYIGGSSVANRKFNWSAATSLTKFLFEKAVTKALLWAEAEMAAGAIEDEIPFAGWIMLTINIAASVAQMTETIVSLATSPWNIENKLAVSITSTVDVFPDPRALVFPHGTDRKYVVKMIYKNANRPTVSYVHDLADNAKPAKLEAVFANNTLGGKVKLEADFYIGKWLAGKATTGWLNNDETTMAQQSLYLVEYPVPLDSSSIYSHEQILIYKNGAYSWMVDKTAPTATLANRNTSPSGNAIGDWTGITLSQRKGMIGNSWQAAGMGIKQCGSDNTGQLYAFQNVTIPGMANIAEKFPNCGFAGKSRMIYDTFPPKFLMKNGNWVIGPDGKPKPDPKDVALGDYYIDPRQSAATPDQGGGYHLRRIVLDDTTPFDMSSSQLSYGRFPLFPDSICLHPSLQVIGINSVQKKLMVAPLVEGGAADIDVPVANFSSGPATDPSRPGLLFYPVSVTAAYDGTILVLEDTSNDPGHNAQQIARISAYDLSMNPVQRFKDTAGKPSYWLYLSGVSGQTFLDLQSVGDERMTYMYLLAYTGSGDKVSDYSMSIYTYGEKPPVSNPLVTTPNISANALAVDMWHSVYTQNYAMVTDGAGKAAGPSGSGTGPDGRTGPSVSMWLPPVPSKSS
ncbi:MAG: hypothetical protein L3J52_02200 [Proteobacteria bacterium]|nr:hypothetical protein [Pseudomonadota bacterium]